MAFRNELLTLPNPISKARISTVKSSRRRACDSKALGSCQSVWPSMGGSNARDALRLYARSTFCLQPPGDTIPRPGIVDAISVGCIPVLFHPEQAHLWSWHWDAAKASVLFDFSRPATRNATRVFEVLLSMPDEDVERLRAAVVQAASKRHRG